MITDDPSHNPVIGITAEDHSKAEQTIEAVKRNGGQPLVILPNDHESVEILISRISALVVCGSDKQLSTENLEASLLKAALGNNMPVLCLSQGLWTLNSVMNGKPPKETLSHAAESPDGDQASSYHRIFITPGSKLAAVVGSGGFVRINSRHSLGLREAQKSPVLLASAYSLEDGVIEALESPAHRLVIGVQFNPERFNELPPHFLRLFQSLADRAKEYQNGAEND